MPTPEQIFEANQNGDFETRLQRLEQEWQLANTFNQPARCNTCHNDVNLVWQPLN